MLNVRTLPLGDYQTNTYLAWEETSDTCVVIDPGYEAETILRAAEEAGKKITAILLTHGHFDHVGAVRSIAHRTGCRIYIHRAEQDQPEQMTGGMLFFSHTYGEGDVLKLAGLEIRVLHTPGHTPGSVCLQVEDTIFAGDTLFAGSIGRTDFPGGSMAQMRQSLARLMEMPENYRVLPGHGAETTLFAEKEQNPYLM